MDYSLTREQAHLKAEITEFARTALPKTSNGKVDRNALQRELQGEKN